VTLPKAARVEEVRRELVHRVAGYFDSFELLLTPMICIPAFPAEGPMPTEINGIAVHGGMAVIHGMLANLVNLPAISIPAGITRAGLPVGLQVIGPRHREDLLLAGHIATKALRRGHVTRLWCEPAGVESSICLCSNGGVPRGSLSGGKLDGLPFTIVE